MDDTYYAEEAAESLIALDFPSQSELVFDFDETDSKKKSEENREQQKDENQSLIQFDKHIDD